MAAASSAQPLIRSDGTGVVNAASYAAQGLPNSPIAQGSIFTIFGSGLGPVQGAQVSAFPLTTLFHGVSISISQGGTTVAALPLYVSASQINAIMPSDAPLGADVIAVTFDGQSSPSCQGCPGAMVEVVPASFGIFAVNQAGIGQGLFTNSKNSLISLTSSATAGEVLNVWGTGLGAIPGSDAEPPVAGNVGSVIPKIYVGGVEVESTYHGRSPCCSGLDQIQFRVPPNVAGCNVPVAVQIGNVVSNFVSIAIASEDHSCSDVNGIPAPDFTEFAAQSAITTGYVGLSRLVFTQVQTQTFFPMATGSVTSTQDYAYGNFEKYDYPTFSLTELPLQILNLGACSVYTFNPVQTSNGPPFPVATPAINSLPGVELDAGTAITINGPNGQKQIAPVPSPFPASVGNYGAELGISPGSTPLYLTQGSYTISGKGGNDVGPFTAAVQMPSALTWTNQSSMNNITRANGVTVTWSGADPGGYVIISGLSLGANGGNAGFNCTAEAASGRFTVPASVLLALPPSGVNESDGIDTSEGSLAVGIATPPVTLNASGLGVGQAISSFSFSQSVAYE
jgi:uncharacterized protein (TIGR03437 family)